MVYLVSKDSKGKIRVVELDLINNKSNYTISRTTYQYQGKKTPHTDIVISEGKAKRTLLEQATLEFNSHLRKYKDKGYKELSGNIEDYTLDQLNLILPKETTDSNGNLKPMLAIDYNKVAVKTFEKPIWWASRKIDGTRAMIFYKDGIIQTSSRGGKDYDFSMRHITNHPKLIKFFENHPEYILDGEIYIHGRPLQYISGVAKIKKEDPRCKELEFWIYDLVMPDVIFEKRLEILKDIKKELNLIFAPTQPYETNELQIRMVPHTFMSGWVKLKNLHDSYVEEGFEGLVIRNKDKEYGIDKRSATYMIKIKSYKDAEFEITGFSEGLREEDMVFTCKTKEGKEFKAKPIGSREIKQQYRNDMDDLIGKMATVKFFYYSEDNVPLQPVLKAIRDYES